MRSKQKFRTTFETDLAIGHHSYVEVSFTIRPHVPLGACDNLRTAHVTAAWSNQKEESLPYCSFDIPVMPCWAQSWQSKA